MLVIHVFYIENHTMINLINAPRRPPAPTSAPKMHIHDFAAPIHDLAVLHAVLYRLHRERMKKLIRTNLFHVPTPSSVS